MRIAIARDRSVNLNGTVSFSDAWIRIAGERGYEPVAIDGFAPDAVDLVRTADAFMWRYRFDRPSTDAAPRLLDAVEDGLGIPVWPCRRSRIYFEDKIRESALLEALGLPHPRTWVFWRREDALAAVAEMRLPVVAKLSRGVQGHGVALLRTQAALRAHILRMFGHGAARLDQGRSKLSRLFGKAETPVRAIVKGEPSRFQEQGYVLLQEFVPGTTGEVRFCFVGERMAYYRTLCRPGDFRASGSDIFDYDLSAVTPATVALALRFRALFGAPSLVVDVMQAPTGPIIGEFSYTTSHFDVDACPTHWRLTPEGPVRVDRPLGYAKAILEDFIERSFPSEAIGADRAIASVTT